jgi:hypothetical protein
MELASMWMLHYIVEQVDIKKPITFPGSTQLSNIWGHPNMELIAHNISILILKECTHVHNFDQNSFVALLGQAF